MVSIAELRAAARICVMPRILISGCFTTLLSKTSEGYPSRDFFLLATRPDLFKPAYEVYLAYLEETSMPAAYQPTTSDFSMCGAAGVMSTMAMTKQQGQPLVMQVPHTVLSLTRITGLSTARDFDDLHKAFLAGIPRGLLRPNGPDHQSWLLSWPMLWGIDEERIVGELTLTPSSASNEIGGWVKEALKPGQPITAKAPITAAPS
jgi:hypothetical protein